MGLPLSIRRLAHSVYRLKHYQGGANDLHYLTTELLYVEFASISFVLRRNCGLSIIIVISYSFSNTEESLPRLAVHSPIAHPNHLLTTRAPNPVPKQSTGTILKIHCRILCDVSKQLMLVGSVQKPPSSSRAPKASWTQICLSE